MCTFVLSRQARKHVLDRICERFLNSRRSDEECRVQAQELLRDCMKALRAQTPDDWRFTRSPAAHFFISIVDRNLNAPPGVISEQQLKLLGGSYRRGEAGMELESRLKRLAKQLHSRGLPVSGRVGPSDVREELAALRSLYLQDLQDSAAPVVHELKTAYGAAEDIAQRRRAKRQSLQAYRHTMVLRSMNLAGLHAALPNALLCEEHEGQRDYRLWVRQGDNWWAPQLRGKKRAQEVALFVPLRREGLDAHEAQLWSFDTDGRIRRVDGACGTFSAQGKCQTPKGFRSESYWNLPTRLDALWLDYDYRHRECVPQLSGEEIVTYVVINWIYDLATAEADGVHPPAWLGKGS